MAAFDFPSSPTTGQVFTQNGVSFVWNGYAWIGNAQQAGPQTEQFLNIAGQTSVDLVVPTWAQSAQLIGSVQTEGTGGPNVGFRYSFDGTTFPAAATDYMNGGPVLNAGSTAYQAFGQSATSLGWLTINGDNANLPNQFTAEINVKRSSTARAWPWKTFGRTLDGAAAALHRTYIAGGFFNGSTSSLEVKTLRILMSNGAAMGAGSWLRVKWLGDSAQVPMGNAIADSPQDGGEYVRVNGIWRQKSKTLVLDGLATTTGVQVDVPAGAKMVKFRGIFATLSNVLVGMGLRISTDGTTFFSSATDYSISGTQLTSTGTTVGPVATSNANILTISTGSNFTVHPVKFDGIFQLQRKAASTYAGQVHTSAAWTTAHVHYVYQLFGNPAGAGDAIKKLAFLSGTAGTFDSMSQLECEWVY